MNLSGRLLTTIAAVLIALSTPLPTEAQFGTVVKVGKATTKTVKATAKPLPPAKLRNFSKAGSWKWQGRADVIGRLAHEPFDIIDDIDVVFMTPADDAEFLNVYGRKPKGIDRDAIDEMAIKERTVGARGARNMSSQDDVLNYIENSRSNTIAFIGHSESRGGELILPNGNRANVRELQEHCAKFRKNCVMVTCFSRDIGLEVEINTSESIEAVIESLGDWESGKFSTAAQLRASLHDKFAKTGKTSYETSGLEVVSIGGVNYLAIIRVSLEVAANDPQGIPVRSLHGSAYKPLKVCKIRGQCAALPDREGAR